MCISTNNLHTWIENMKSEINMQRVIHVGNWAIAGVKPGWEKKKKNEFFVEATRIWWLKLIRTPKKVNVENQLRKTSSKSLKVISVGLTYVLIDNFPFLYPEYECQLCRRSIETIIVCKESLFRRNHRDNYSLQRVFILENNYSLQRVLFRRTIIKVRLLTFLVLLSSV